MVLTPGPYHVGYTPPSYAEPEKSIRCLLHELSNTICNVPQKERLYWIEFCESLLRSSIQYNSPAQPSIDVEPSQRLPKRQKRQNTDAHSNSLVHLMVDTTEMSTRPHCSTRGKPVKETRQFMLPRLRSHTVVHDRQEEASVLLDDASNLDQPIIEERARQLERTSSDPRPNSSQKQLTRTRRETPLQRIKKIKSSKEWNQIDRSMTFALDPVKISKLRLQFQIELLKLEGTARHGNRLQNIHNEDHDSDVDKHSDKLFSKTEAAQMTAYFFEVTMGEPALQQVIDFVTNYDIDRITGHDKGATARFMSIASDKTLPNGVRKFFAAYMDDCKQGSALIEDRAVAKDKDVLVMTHIEDVLRALNTLRQYKLACEDAEKQSAALWKYLEKKLGAKKVKQIKTERYTTTRKGVGNASIAKDLLALVGDIDRDKLTRRVGNIRATEIVLDRLGEAFLLVMCPSSSGFLRHLGTVRVDAACDILLRLCPFVTHLVEVLDTMIWQPFKRGERCLNVDIMRIKAKTPDQSFLEILQSSATINMDL